MTTSNEFEHRGRRIELQSYRSDGGRWRPKALVIAFSGGSVHHKLVNAPVNITFDSEQEANGYALPMAKKWIDENG